MSDGMHFYPGDVVTPIKNDPNNKFSIGRNYTVRGDQHCLNVLLDMPGSSSAHEIWMNSENFRLVSRAKPDHGPIRERALDLALKWASRIDYDAEDVVLAAKRFEDYLRGGLEPTNVGIQDAPLTAEERGS